jgi:hypothetical protein
MNIPKLSDNIKDLETSIIDGCVLIPIIILVSRSFMLSLNLGMFIEILHK